MALEGSLTDFGLADILQLIYFQRKTGILTLQGKLDKVTLHFMAGNVVGAESRRRIDDNRLGRILLRRGLIKEEDLQAALEEHKQSKVRLGDIVIEKGYVTKEAVRDIINGQITETIIQLFSWKQGTYEFNARVVPESKVLSTSLDTQHLLMEGLRIVDEWSSIRERITLDTVFRKSGADTSEMSQEELEILKYVDGESDVSTIIDLSGGDNFEISKTLLSLMERGVVEKAEAAPVIGEAVTFTAEKKKPLPMLNLLVPGAIGLSLVLSLFTTAFIRGGLSKEFRAAGKIEVLRSKIEAYKFEHSFYPASFDVISSDSDPWGHEYIYRVSGDSFFLASAGADGKEGSADDIY